MEYIVLFIGLFTWADAADSGNHFAAILGVVVIGIGAIMWSARKIAIAILKAEDEWGYDD